ncbi:alpha-hydroxy acid oxidase [Egicoccus sp. AB-alg2]|uniref:alpha-hydroxy acid oxidase n=1 Tax=Egicoccus sp. AB-alg2 TaxID=3242693 RepID=UPI00359F0AE0
MDLPAGAPTADELWDAGLGRLSAEVRDHLLGGASDGCGPARNRAALEQVLFVPKVVGGARPPDLGTTFLGRRISAPFGTAPIGSVDLATPQAARAIVEVLARRGLAGFVGLLALEDLRTMAPLPESAVMLQLYLRGDDGWLHETVKLSEDKGFHGFCVTVDSREKAYRPRDRRNRYVKRDNLGKPPNLPDDPLAYDHQRAVDWQRLERLRAMTDRPLVLKGLLHTAEARRAVEVGFDGVYVSNHGGRNVGHTIATAEALAEIAQVVPEECAVVVDGGFRDAEDVLKARCLGADLVTFGRSHFLALAAGGAAGLEALFEALDEQMRLTMRLLGVESLAELTPDLVRIGPPWQTVHAHH